MKGTMMTRRTKSFLGRKLSRIATTLILVAGLSLSGCCTFCKGTICAPGTQVDPDGGGETVQRDGLPAVKGGTCIPDP